MGAGRRRARARRKRASQACRSPPAGKEAPMSPPPNAGGSRRPPTHPINRRRQRRRAQSRRRRKLAALAFFVIAIFAAVGSAGFGEAQSVNRGCDLGRLKPVLKDSNSFIYAADGSRLGSIPAERNRQPVPLREISPWIGKATVAIEDRRYYEHGGIDLEGIARAAVNDIRAGGTVEGGSTITQQLVRNLYTPPPA